MYLLIAGKAEWYGNSRGTCCGEWYLVDVGSISRRRSGQYWMTRTAVEAFDIEMETIKQSTSKCAI